MGKIYNISSGLSFVDAFVKGLMEKIGNDPMKLSQYLLLLPSRRACRAMADAFLRASEGRPILLPQMQPIGDVDAEELIVTGNEELEELPAISKLERQLLLAKLVQQADKEKSFDQAVSMSSELGRFLDEIQADRLSFEDLEKIVPDEFAEHWQKTLDFLKILTQYWPLILKERGLADIAERRNSLIDARINEWKNNPPDKNIIAVGSVGPMPIVAELITLIASMDRGEVVLPGVDMFLDDESWNKISEDSPQYNIRNLLNKIGITRSELINWCDNVEAVNKDRVKLISEAMRPAETTDKWRLLTSQDIAEHALAGLSRIDCDTSQEEAEVISMIIREVLEEPAKTCALVTSDRRLARRVSQSLKRWGVNIDDSGGQPLTEFAVGSYILSLAETAVQNLSPVSLLAFLKHPLTALGMEGGALREKVSFLDERVLRGPRHLGGFAGIREQALPLSNEEFMQWLAELENIMGEFVGLMTNQSTHNFKTYLKAHIEMAEKLATALNISGADRLWKGDAGEAAAKFIADLFAMADNIPDLSPSDYLSVFYTLLKSNTVRPRFGTHPRLFILGQMESRLYCADKIILGGLNEGTWPKGNKDDPWMSRPMRKSFGLPSLEKEVGISAHDFSQLACAKEVVFTRARKVDGTPATPSRWLMRIETVLSALGLEINKQAEFKYRKWVEALDKPDGEIKPILRPEPCPPISSRPKELSVTNIERLMRDPYQIYAKYILNLKPLDDLDADAGGAEKGTFIHAALERFIKEFKDEIPVNAKERLLELGNEELNKLKIADEVKAYWLPRFNQVAEIFIEKEVKHRENAAVVDIEIKGELQLANGFKITGKADRIDKLNSGGYAIIDYKSGFIPSNSEVKDGLSPQLPLEAVILQEGGFPNIEECKVENLIYWKVSGGGQEPVEVREISPRNISVEQLINDAAEGVKELSNYFSKEDSRYISYPRSDVKVTYSDYEHLSRVKEWGISGDE